jgi:hypothetical protein
MRKRQTSLLDSQKTFSDEAICAGPLFERRSLLKRLRRSAERLAESEERTVVEALSDSEGLLFDLA